MFIGKNCGWLFNVFVLLDGRFVWVGIYFFKKNWVEILEYFVKLYDEDWEKLDEYVVKIIDGL